MTPADVPAGPLIVDTDVASFILTNREPAHLFKPLLRGHVLCMSFATVGELWAGAENPKCSWGPTRRAELDKFIRHHVVLPADDAVARYWARIHAVVRNQVDVNDEWIAACALAGTPPMAVATGNVKHFKPIAARFPGLTLVHPGL